MTSTSTELKELDNNNHNTNSNDASGSTTTAQSDPVADAEAQIKVLTQKLRAGIVIKDRKWLMTTYANCFVGSEAVTFMVDSGISNSRADAVHLGSMLEAANIIAHVAKDHDFKDGKFFYTFVEDLPSHGQKAKKDNSGQDWSWSDFIPGMNRNRNSEHLNLQPQMAQLNAQVLDAVDPDDLSPHETFGITPMDKYNQEMLDNVHPLKWEAPTPQTKYNLIAIGAGAAGLVSAAGAAGVGGKSAIIEEELFGGDCLVSGCVPSKALLRAAKVAYDAIVNGAKFGLVVDGSIRIDFGAVMERMRRIRAEISHHDACERFAKVYGMDVFLGRGVFVSPDTIKVGNTELKFARCVIATGAKASVPPIPGLAECPYLTNHTIWNLTKRPERLGVIGSGPIGCEMAQAFALLGSKVTVMNRSDTILGKEDPEAAAVVRKSMEVCGCVFQTGLKFVSCEVIAVENNDSVANITNIIEVLESDNSNTNNNNAANQVEDNEEVKEDSTATSSVKPKTKPSAGSKTMIRVTVERTSTGKTEQFVFDRLLVATGRKPNVLNMGLELAHVNYDERKGIYVNDFLQTSNTNIYSAGDCCTRFQFTHMADAMARIVIRNALFFGRTKVSELIIPWCTFTFPEVAHVGLYENDLRARSIDFDSIKIDLSHNDRAICDGEAEYHGFVKVLLKRGTDNILGATIVSANAGDQISEITLAIQTKTGLGFLGSVIHPYPTVCEGIKHAGDAFNRTKLTPTTKFLLRRILSARL